MKKVELNHLLEAGVHFGHLTSKNTKYDSIYFYGKEWDAHHRFK